MFLLKSNDSFLEKKIALLLEQKNFKFTIDESEKYFFIVDFFFSEKKINLSAGGDTLSINLPTTLLNIFSNLRDILINKKIETKLFEYRPIEQTLSIKKKICTLGAIHNLIILNLVLYHSDGVNKIFLYKQIWPNDKNIQINKLDTHITNLKNRIKNELFLDLPVSTQSGNLKLMID